jgi:hypothetical protein
VSWTVVWREKRPENPQIGDAWFYKPEEEGGGDYYPREFMEKRMSAAFAFANRPAIFVVLPDKDNFCVDWAWWSNGVVNEAKAGWNVALLEPPVIGQKLRITLTPSINAPPYHGFITDGVISNDVSGRKF